MIVILQILGSLILLTLLSSAILHLVYKCRKKRKFIAEHKIHVMFPVQLALALASVIICGFWFITGKDVFDYGCLWVIIERGTLEALTSVMSIVGVGSILLGWIYSERDKLTLGKSQIDMIHHCYGSGYAGSIAVHFGSTALAILMLNCIAKEAALWSFATVAWGCIPQVLICLQIAMNRDNRESLALQLWKHEGCIPENQLSVIHKMAAYLSETDVRLNSDYCKTLGAVIRNWLIECYNKDDPARGATQANIRTVSAIFREMSEKIPEAERASFEEELIKIICAQVEADFRANEKKDVAIDLLSCGYLRFIYEKSKKTLEQRINGPLNYYLHSDGLYRDCIIRMRDFYSGLEWFLFLNQLAGVPQNVTRQSPHNDYIENIFVQLILSICENDVWFSEKYARISWKQLHSGGK